jgi:arylsulfatase A-like enzyme
MPGLTEGGKIVTQLVQNLDFAPTFLDLAGVEIPEDMQGLSLLPLLKEEDPVDLRESLYYHYYEYPGAHSVKRHYGIRNDQYKLIHFYHDIDAWELYDLKRDPSEMDNLIDDPEYKELIQSLKDELRELQIQYQDTISN